MNSKFLKHRLEGICGSAKRLRIHAALLSVMIAVPIASTTPAYAADRVLQVLGACNGGDAQFTGNSKKGRSQLSSADQAALAGFVLEGVEGTKISDFRGLAIEFEPPQGTNVATFELRVRVAGEENDKVQDFIIGEPDPNHPKLPNLPTKHGAGLSTLNIRSGDLLQEHSKLLSTDIVKKLSLIFHSNSKTSVTQQRLNVDFVFYNLAPVSILLEPITCNLK